MSKKIIQLGFFMSNLISPPPLINVCSLLGLCLLKKRTGGVYIKCCMPLNTFKKQRLRMNGGKNPAMLEYLATGTAYRKV